MSFVIVTFNGVVSIVIVRVLDAVELVHLVDLTCFAVRVCTPAARGEVGMICAVSAIQVVDPMRLVPS